MKFTVHEIASQLNFILMAREPRQTVKRVLEFEKIFDRYRYLKNNESSANAPLLKQLSSWLEIAQPHREEFKWLQYYLILWLDKRGGGDIEVDEVLNLFANVINDYKPSDLSLTWKPATTKLLLNSSNFFSN